MKKLSVFFILLAYLWCVHIVELLFCFSHLTLYVYQVLKIVFVSGIWSHYVIFHQEDLLFVWTCLYSWLLKVFPDFPHCKQCCNEHLCTFAYFCIQTLRNVITERSVLRLLKVCDYFPKELYQIVSSPAGSFHGFKSLVLGVWYPPVFTFVCLRLQVKLTV